ncbi:MAG: hypothetical protein Ta2C_01750 [Candidatus Endomicrobiellum trichonymphae]|nr:MAG: hypothetical protein Ta2C_01750 [Candidatus Endomicrobium trichonymphae]
MMKDKAYTTPYTTTTVPIPIPISKPSAKAKLSRHSLIFAVWFPKLSSQFDCIVASLVLHWLSLFFSYLQRSMPKAFKHDTKNDNHCFSYFHFYSPVSKFDIKSLNVFIFYYKSAPICKQKI